jgi:O-acetyl-ADP-ribose deacetylase (regulator of RNase III)
MNLFSYLEKAKNSLGFSKASTLTPVSKVKIEVVSGDITKETTDAIVNAANSSLLGGSGVDGAIHAAAGPSVLAECEKLNGCETGDAKATLAGNLPTKHIIHAVGPQWNGGDDDEATLLESAYKRSIEVADSLGASSVSFPAISCGIYRYPLELAVPISIRAAREAAEASTNVRLVRFVIFDPALLEAFQEGLALELASS